jgi:hypothetical protein
MLIDKSPTLSISLLICTADDKSNRSNRLLQAKHTLADIIDFNIEFINLIFCFLFSLQNRWLTALTASAT